MYEPIQHIKPLNTDQYQAAVDRALSRVKHKIGDRPTRKQFQRELGRVWTVLDILAIVIFIAAFAISSAHIITHMGALASASFESRTGGIVLDENTYVYIHQVGMMLLAEASMLLFMVMHGLSSAQRKGRLRFLSLPLLLALVAAVFVFISNWQSNIGLLEALMPPVFTVGIGLRLEYLIVILLSQRAEVDRQYTAAINEYDLAMKDPTSHPAYAGFLKMELWQALAQINRDQRDAPTGVKQLAVRRELERDLWTKMSDQPIPEDYHQPKLKAPPTLPRLDEPEEETAQIIRLSPEDREARARELLQQHPGLTVRDLAKALNVSNGTAGNVMKSIR